MDLGAFSISLAVKDLAASRTFYEKLGFTVAGGQADQNWLIMKNGDHTIGLFQGMFEKNILTFNPGWNQKSEKLDTFSDIRDIQKHLVQEGVELGSSVDESTEGPGSLSVTDPDGNTILIDQHV